MLPDTVISQTLERFPAYQGEDFDVSPLEKGGSERKFYRIQAGVGHSMIVVKYSGQKEENKHYVDIALFLSLEGVNVPKIYFHDPVEGLIWMQDLGRDDLWAFRGESWEKRRPLYESALEEVSKMHGIGPSHLEKAGLRLEREFSHQLYLWEQNYFFENCLGAHFQMGASDVSQYVEMPIWQDIAGSLAARPRSLVHRDFQSQNILIHEGAAALIDFQGMRPGLPQYDVASLLFDPYVTLSANERDYLLDFYKLVARRNGQDVREDFDNVYYQCALQRLMQALGAYGFLGVQKGRADFLTHIPAARRNLREVAVRIDGLDAFVNLLDTLP